MEKTHTVPNPACSCALLCRPFPASALKSHICPRLWQVASGYRNEVAATKKLTSSLTISYTQPQNSLIMVTCPKASAVPAARALLPTDDATVTAGSSSGCGRIAFNSLITLPGSTLQCCSYIPWLTVPS